MADRPPPGGAATLRQLITRFSPSSNQALGLLTLSISGAILLLFTGLTLTLTVLSLIFFLPLILLSLPLWLPLAAVFFFFLSLGGVGVAGIAMASWSYRYVRGRHPPGSDRLDYARSRIADTAGHVKEYAREYGGYLRGRIKDAAPGA